MDQCYSTIEISVTKSVTPHSETAVTITEDKMEGHTGYFDCAGQEIKEYDLVLCQHTFVEMDTNKTVLGNLDLGIVLKSFNNEHYTIYKINSRGYHKPRLKNKSYNEVAWFFHPDESNMPNKLLKIVGNAVLPTDTESAYRIELETQLEKIEQELNRWEQGVYGKYKNKIQRNNIG